VIKDLLGVLNYRVKDLGVSQGLAVDVPDDATLVLVLGPRTPLLPEELASLDRYMERGGALLFALEPGTEVTLGPLSQRFGVQFSPKLVVDDKHFVPQRRSEAEFMGAGELEDAEFAPEIGDAKPKRTYIVRSLTDAFADANGNFTHDADETRGAANLIAASEGAPKEQQPAQPGLPAEPARGMRAIIMADVQAISDGVLSAMPPNQALILDTVKWLGGEEQFTGEVSSEKDLPIQHTEDQDKVLFYSTIIGAPLLVLFGGLFSVWLRRRPTRRAS
jgi:hypothetical protein